MRQRRSSQRGEGPKSLYIAIKFLNFLCTNMLSRSQVNSLAYVQHFDDLGIEYDAADQGAEVEAERREFRPEQSLRQRRDDGRLRIRDHEADRGRARTDASPSPHSRPQGDEPLVRQRLERDPQRWECDQQQPEQCRHLFFGAPPEPTARSFDMPSTLREVGGAQLLRRRDLPFLLGRASADTPLVLPRPVELSTWCIRTRGLTWSTAIGHGHRTLLEDELPGGAHFGISSEARGLQPPLLDSEGVDRKRCSAYDSNKDLAYGYNQSGSLTSFFKLDFVNTGNVVKWRKIKKPTTVLGRCSSTRKKKWLPVPWTRKFPCAIRHSERGISTCQPYAYDWPLHMNYVFKLKIILAFMITYWK